VSVSQRISNVLENPRANKRIIVLLCRVGEERDHSFTVISIWTTTKQTCLDPSGWERQRSSYPLHLKIDKFAPTDDGRVEILLSAVIGMCPVTSETLGSGAAPQQTAVKAE
jgi:hypothetical protein